MVSHHKSLSDPFYYPYLQIQTFAFSVWLHIFDNDFHVRHRILFVQYARQPFPFAFCTRVYRTETLTTVPPDTWVELHDDDIIQMGSSQTFKYRVMIPLSPILIPEIVPASKPHLLKLAFPGSCIARIIGQRGQVINHIKETFKCTIFSANQGVYVSGLESSQARLFKIGAESFTRRIESVDEVLRVSQINDDPVGLHIILPDSAVGKLQGSQGHGLEQLGARSGVQVNLLPGHLLHCRGTQEGALNVVKFVVGVLGPIPSGYEPDNGSEEGVQVPARNRNDHANTLLPLAVYTCPRFSSTARHCTPQTTVSRDESGEGSETRQKRADEITSQGRPKTPCNFWSV